jgi:hypothetical protein
MPRSEWSIVDSQNDAKRFARWRDADELKKRREKERFNKEREAFIEARGRRFLKREERRRLEQEREERQIDEAAVMNILRGEMK